MPAGSRGTVLDRFIGACMTVLLGATALFVAVKLLEAIWIALVVIAFTASFVTIAVVVLRGRRDSW
jgi:hypothetical protein